MSENTPKKKKRKGERPDGLIQVSLKIGVKPDGKPDRKYFYGHTRAEAERKRDKYKAEREIGCTFSPDITVQEWTDVFLTTYRTQVNEAYLDGDAVPYNRLAKQIGKMRMADVRESDLQKALNKVDGMSYSTVNKYKQAITRLFERAQKNKIIQDNPAEDLIMPKYEKGSHRALERWEIEHILEHWNDPAARAGLWVMLMMLCGLRRGEMMALEWESINMETRTLEVSAVAVVLKSGQTIIEKRAKSDAGLRILPICNTLYEALNSVPKSQRTGYVCLSARGKLLTESAANRGVESFCRVLERILNGEPTRIPSRRPKSKDKKDEAASKKPRIDFSFTAHDLRHTYATALYDAGVPVKAAQYFLGHADIRLTLDLYTHLSKEREASSRNQMVKYLDDWLDKRVVNTLNFNVDPLQIEQ